MKDLVGFCLLGTVEHCHFPQPTHSCEKFQQQQALSWPLEQITREADVVLYWLYLQSTGSIKSGIPLRSDFPEAPNGYPYSCLFFGTSVCKHTHSLYE